MPLIFVLIVMGICAVIGGFLWPYSLNAWLHFFSKPETVVWWHGALLGFCPFIGQITIPFAIITWILMLFLV
jgi:hypothetical protein